MNTFVCVDGSFHEDDIVVTEEPSGAGWVEFDPGGIVGRPHQIPIPPEVRPAAGELLLHYRIEETGERFFLSWKPDRPNASMIPVIGSGHHHDGDQENDGVYQRSDPAARPRNRTGFEDIHIRQELQRIHMSDGALADPGLFTWSRKRKTS